MMIARLFRRSRTCGTCGHSRTAHEHYRPGSDCGACTCGSFRR